MRFIGLKMSLLIALMFILCGSALATIDVVRGSTCSNGCSRTVVQPIAQGKNHSFEVVGQYVDLSTSVEISGSGVSVSYGERKHGSGSSIIIKFDVDDSAAPGERTIKMHYAIETNGPDTFKVRVINRGSISQIQYRKPVQTNPTGSRINSVGGVSAKVNLSGASQLVPATDIPLNEPVILVITGSKLDHAQVMESIAFQNAKILPGATDSKCEIQLTFTQSGSIPIFLFDSSMTSLEILKADVRLQYANSTSHQVQVSGTQTSSVSVNPPLTGSSGSSSTFIDVAPRANMLNVFRRQFTSPTFTDRGTEYFSITGEHCSGMTGDQTKIITIPNPVWGVTNVGTAAINTAFTSQLRSGTQNLDTQNINTLTPGETRNFTFTRQNSTVRVFTFLLHNGCFVSPTADRFFEDPPFTVVVNTNNSVVEAANNQFNNSRNY